MVFTVPLPLVPAPASVTMGEGRTPITTSTLVFGDSPAVLQLIDGVERRAGIRLATTDAAADADIVLGIDPTAGTSESYVLSVADRVVVTAADEAGLFYGVQTLLQLLHDDEGWGLRRADIADAPRFAHRGVMLDVARHFFGVGDVLRFIDAASALKFNRLHLHLSDDQGWRLRIDAWPKLTEVASSTSACGDPGGFYTHDDYREIVAHAASRHMILIPEIDLPGHTHAIGVAYPELVEAPVLSDAIRAQSEDLGQPVPVHGEPYTGWAVGHSSVRIHEESTYGFVTGVVRELAALTPGPYLHIGGDESLGTAQDDFDLFAARATQIVVDAGKIPVAWHEMGSAAGIAEGTIGQYWGSTTPKGTHADEARRFVERGGALVMSPSDAAYLDMKVTADDDLGLDWAGLIDLTTAYGWEPTAIVDVPESAILGVEAPVWSETLRTIADVEYMVFPRAAAIAEIAWSPRSSRDLDSFRERLTALLPLWTAAGVRFRPLSEVDEGSR